jgi:hypothetical protein
MAGTSERAGYTTLDFELRDANGPSATAVFPVASPILQLKVEDARSKQPALVDRGALKR